MFLLLWLIFWVICGFPAIYTEDLTGWGITLVIFIILQIVD